MKVCVCGCVCVAFFKLAKCEPPIYEMSLLEGRGKTSSIWSSTHALSCHLNPVSFKMKPNTSSLLQNTHSNSPWTQHTEKILPVRRWSNRSQTAPSHFYSETIWCSEEKERWTHLLGQMTVQRHRGGKKGREVKALQVSRWLRQRLQTHRWWFRVKLQLHLCPAPVGECVSREWNKEQKGKRIKTW